MKVNFQGFFNITANYFINSDNDAPYEQLDTCIKDLITSSDYNDLKNGNFKILKYKNAEIIVQSN